MQTTCLPKRFCHWTTLMMKIQKVKPAEMVQYSEILKRYKMQQFKDNIASDLDNDTDYESVSDDDRFRQKIIASEKWGTRREAFYGAEGEDELVLGAPGAREDQVEAEEEAAEMEEAEVDRLRSLLYGSKCAGRTAADPGGLLFATLDREVGAAVLVVLVVLNCLLRADCSRSIQRRSSYN